MRAVMLWVAVLAAFAGVLRGAGRNIDTSSICGVAEDHGLGIEWATKVAPRAGQLADLVFAVRSSGTALGAETARAAVKAAGSGTILCQVDVPCVVSAGTTFTGTCPAPDFAATALLSLSWDTSSCLTRPRGHASANLAMP